MTWDSDGAQNTIPVERPTIFRIFEWQLENFYKNSAVALLRKAATLSSKAGTLFFMAGWNSVETAIEGVCLLRLNVDICEDLYRPRLRQNAPTIHSSGCSDHSLPPNN